MKLKIEIIDEWPEAAKNKGWLNHINYHDDSLTPPQRRLFVLENDKVYEHTILCPILSDIPDNILIKVETIDSNNFIIDTDCQWPENISPQHGFEPQSEFNHVGFGYLYAYTDIDVLPSHIEFNAMKRQYHHHLGKTSAWPLLKIIEIS